MRAMDFSRTVEPSPVVVQQAVASHNQKPGFDGTVLRALRRGDCK
jgi:hypothetical protein